MTSCPFATWSCLGDFLSHTDLLSKIQRARCLWDRVCLIEPNGVPNDLEMFNPAFVRTNYWNVLMPP